MKPAIDLAELASNLVVTGFGEKDSDGDNYVFENEDGLQWTRYSATHGVEKAPYDIPPSNGDIEQQMQRYLKHESLFVSFIPLDFFTLPMWPREKKDWKSCFDAIFYVCLECDSFVGPYAQLCMQFYIPSIIRVPNPTAVMQQKDTYPWSWIPRLLCRNCAREIGSSEGETLTYYPFCMYAQRAIAKEMDGALSKLRSTRAISVIEGHAESTPLVQCSMCLQPLHAKKKKKKKQKQKNTQRREPGPQFCGTECKQSWDLMVDLKQQERRRGGRSAEEAEEMTGLFQLLELFDVMQTYRVDVNLALCWKTVCSHIDGHERDANNGHFTTPALFCKQCHRVAYCSHPCLKQACEAKQHQCTRSWRELFVPSRLYIQKE